MHRVNPVQNNKYKETHKLNGIVSETLYINNAALISSQQEGEADQIYSQKT